MQRCFGDSELNFGIIHWHRQLRGKPYTLTDPRLNIVYGRSDVYETSVYLKKENRVDDMMITKLIMPNNVPVKYCISEEFSCKHFK